MPGAHALDPFDVPLDVLRSTRTSYKWRGFDASLLPCFVAEMDCILAPPISEALRHAVETSDTGYAWNSRALREACAGFLQQRYGLSVACDDVHVVPDVMTGVLETLRRITTPGDGVVIMPPVYAPFFHHIEEAGCRVVEAPLQRDGEQYAMDLDAVRRVFDAGARVLLLCNPHNPTGTVFDPDTLRSLVELAAGCDAWILSDEIHAPLVLDGARHTPLLAVAGAAERTFMFTSASKGWNLAGLKCAQIVAVGERPRRVVESFPEAVTFRSGQLGVIASTAAYGEAGGWLDAAVAAITRKHRLFSHMLAETLPAVRVTRAAATYLAWLDCAGLGLGDDPAVTFRERGRVLLDSGPKYGACAGAGFARATIATADSVLEEIVSRMAGALR